MSFDCSKCGACCRAINTLPQLSSYDRGDGVCKYLTTGNTCSIYERRPDVCRMDQMHPAVLTTREWHQRNHRACERLHLHIYGQELPR
jgi:hypothetical protein